MSANSVHYIFLYWPWAKNGFYYTSFNDFFKWFFDRWKLYKIQISLFINKHLLESSQTHLLMYCLWLLLFYKISCSWVVVTEVVFEFSLFYTAVGLTTNYSDVVIIWQHLECHMYNHNTVFFPCVYYQCISIKTKQKRKVNFKCHAFGECR